MLEVYKEEILRLKTRTASTESESFPSKQAEMDADIEVFIGLLVLVFKAENLRSYSFRYIRKDGYIELCDSETMLSAVYKRLADKWMSDDEEVTFRLMLLKQLDEISISFSNMLDDSDNMPMQFDCEKTRVTFSIQL